MATLDRFKCDACGKSYAWKPELAGKKVRCKCGGVVLVPKPPEPEHSDEDNSLDDLYALTGDDRPKVADQGQGLNCPSCQAQTPPGAMICTNCGLNFQTGQRVGAAAPSSARPALAMAGAGATAAPRTLGYAGRKPVADDKAAADAREEMKMLIAPSIVAVIGLIATFCYGMQAMELSFGSAALYVGLITFINLILLSVALLLSMKMLDFSLGAPQIALVKVLAVALLPGVAAAYFQYYGGFKAMFFGWAISLIFYRLLLFWFFDLDGMESYIVTGIIWIIRNIVGTLVVLSLMGMLIPGRSFSNINPMSFLIGDGKEAITTDPSTLAGRINGRAQNRLLIRDTAEEGRQWVQKGDNRNIIDMDHAATVKFINDMYDAGAVKVTTTDVHEMGPKLQAEKVVIQLPSDPAKRRKIFAIQQPYFANRDVEQTDIGKEMAYLILDFDGNDE